jgi:SAM-dependent methyltransferase
VRDAVRRATRAATARAWSAARLAERFFRLATVATLTDAERDALRVREWEAFARSPPVGDGLFEWEAGWYRDHIPPAALVLVVGAGTGRDALALAASGLRVTALDLAPEALSVLRDRARLRGIEVPTIESSVERADLEPGSFDAVVFSWFAYGYIRGVDARVDALRRTAGALRPGGRILVSYQTGVGDAGPRLARLIGPIARFLGTSAPEPQDSYGMARTGGVLSVSHARLLSGEDVESEARRAGLRVVFHDQAGVSTGRAVFAPLV